jgi:hypothetical protein
MTLEATTDDLDDQPQQTESQEQQPSQKPPPDIGKVNREAQSLSSGVVYENRNRQSPSYKSRIEAFERADLERAAAGILANPADLWLVHSVEDFRDESGEIDTEKATEAFREIARTKPNWSVPMINLDQGRKQSVNGAPSMTWADAFSRNV